MHVKFWWGDLRERDHLEDLSVNIKIILKRIFKKLDVEAMAGMLWFRIGTRGGCFECGIKPSGSIKCEKFVN